MKIKDLFARGKRVFSFEFFPPKDDAGVAALFETVTHLKELEPSFVSVTYGAGGSTRRKTVEITKRIKQELGIEAMSHLTCVGHGREEISAVLDDIEAAGIENIMTLRGDAPRGETQFVPHAQGFGHANELVTFIRSRKPGFCLGVAGYPEGHPEAPSKEEDLANLKRKVDAGADFIVTQLFFDNRDYFDLRERAARIGISLPIVPGIMPITDVAQIKRFTQMCGAKIPAALLAQLETADGNKDRVAEIGIAHSTEQCRALLENGAPGIHFYTLNKSLSTRTILSNLKADPG
jgi:methylenetetrahydrofolate reductase (NADPH)